MATSSTQLQRFLYLVARLLLVYLILGFVSSFSALAQVSGVVFRDFNANGTRETLEVGVASVTVTATFSGTIATTVSTTTGAYSFNAATIPSGTAVRLEFLSNIANDYSGPVTTSSGGNRSSVQFVTAGSGTTTANYAVNQPSDYCQATPDLITNCYVNGAVNGTGISDVLVKWPYSNSGTSTTGKSTISTKSQSGQTWGLGYDRNQKKIYAAAFLKRHSGLLDNNADGFGDLGAIYQIDPATSANSLWLDVTTLGVNVGTIGNDAARGLTNTGSPSNDPTSYTLVGQVGLGDLDISDDNTTMYVVSLNQQELLVIDIATKALLGKYTIPNPGCTGGSPRPFGVKYYRGAVYVGVICDAATSQLKANLSATIYRFDGSSFTSVLNFPLTYPKGAPIIFSCRSQTGWFPWVSTLPAACEENVISYPQPILSDIEFDTDGAMILGFFDRNAHQGGWGNFGLTGNTLYYHISGGDILRAALVNGSYVLENKGVAGSVTGNTTNNQGPGGGEFYQGDQFNNTTSVPHEETSLGGLTLIPGRGQVAVTSMDPIDEIGENQYQSGGVIFLSNTNGTKQRSFRVYSRNDLGTFGKAAGLGDLEALCDPAPIQIGNRVWRDNNRNGIQDPGEPAIPGAVVTLYDATGTTAIASVTTNAAGEYYFSSTTLTTGTSTSSVATSALVPNTSYALVVTSLGTSTVVNGLSLSSVSPLTPGEATSANSGTTTTNNDALSVGGRPTIQLTTGPPGSVNHTYDFGFVIPPGSLGDFVWEDANRNGQQDVGEPGIPNVTVSLLSSGTLVATTTTDASGLYSFTGLTPGVPYSVSFTAPGGYSATLQNVGSDVTDSDGNPLTGLTGVYSLTADEFNPTVDMGYYRPASLGDFVWVDVNQNGQQDVGEPGLPNVTVTLLSSGTVVATTTTNASGLYSFTGLTPGVPYSVSFTTPTNYTATLANVGNDLSDSDPVGGVTAPVTLTSGENNTSLDAGFILRTAGLGDFVWEDANRNGQQDVGEPGIPNVTVSLLSSGTLVATTTTDASGLYSFTGLTPGVPYSVSFTAPGGYSATLQNVGSDVTDSDGNPLTGLTGVYSLTADEFNPTVDMGYYRPASVGDFVWVDVNQNGQQDVGEPGLPNVTVTLLSSGTVVATTATDASGLYSFTGLTPGVPYSVSFTTPTNYTATLANVGNDLSDSDPVGGVTAPVTLTSGENNTSLDAGFILRTAGLGDFVWEDVNRNGQQDVGEPGIPGVTVTLLSSGTLVATTTTDASGLYSFTGLTPGVPYSVSFTAPGGYSATLQNVGSDVTDSDGNPVTGLTGVYSLTADEFNPTVDMGYYRPASLGDFVWVDVNQNGQQDVGEPGLPGVVVTLLDGTNTPIASTTTNASGLYSFTGLTPGVPYSVSFTTPTNYTATLSNVGNDLSDSDPVGGVTAPVTLTSGENNTSLDAGFILRTAGLGDFVWEDVNRNGQQDVGEPGIPNVTVSLLSSGTLVATTTTDASGLYSFTGLTPGVPYSVSFTAPGGYSATLQNVGSDVTDSDGNPLTGLTGVYSLTADEFNPTVDMGYYRPASVGDFVWVDVNQNGQQDVGEPGLPNVTVTLLSSGTVVATTATDASGLYSFTGLTPGVPYSVSFTTPTNYTATLANVGNDLSDSDPVGGVTAPVTLTSGENNTSLDAGFILRTAGLGDFVWEDVNRNGQQDVGEPGIPGVTVTLLSSGTLVATTTTDASGLYSFTGLTPGVPYSVSFTAPGGYSATLQNVGSDVTDSDGNPVTGLTGVYSLTADEFNPTVDMGYYRPASLGDFVWVDVNQNGQQDVGEPGLPGVVVTLLDGTNTPIASTTTNASGLYSFTGLTPGVPYSVSFTTPTNYTATLSNVGNDLSDSDPVGGVTAPVTLTSGENNTSLDAGFILRTAGLGDFVWEDVNRNGQQDVGEPGIPGVTVTLLSSGTLVATTTTDASGLYSFTGLTPGVPYSVSFTAPGGYSATLQNVGSDVTDSDGNPVTGLTGVYSLTADEFNPTVDMGYYRPASLGDFVWLDVNQNGQQDVGEPGLPGVVATLLDGTNTPIASTTTNASGLYSFTGLTPGVPYSVSFTTPTNYTTTLSNVGNDLSDSDPVGGVTAPVTLTSGENNTSLDAGFILRTAGLGDFVWEDVNRNGQQDVGEPGIPGVTVTLLSSGTLVATTTTDASGLYSFTGLTPGVPYSVSFTAPAGYSATLQNVGSDVTDSDGNPVTGLTGVYSLTADEFNPTVDMGYYRPASLGDFVWVDVNQNGQQDVGEPGLPNVTVTLLSSGTVVATTTTDASGLYSFTGLTPGVPYSVSFTTPTNYTATLANVGNDLTDSDPVSGVTAPVTLTSGENNTSLDAGFILQTAGLGDFVWEDVNRNGQQDVGEPGIPGVTVTLLSSGTLVATTTTDASGLYSFTGLTPGVPYSVSFTAPAGYSATLQNVGSDVTDSDGNPLTGLTGVYSLTADEFNPTVDMGYYRPASLGDFVWVDVNQNGQQDVGEPGIPNVTVTLLSSGTVVATTTTNASGLYSFTGLTPGVPYSVSFTTPTNYTATLANVGNDLTDSDPVGGVTAPVTLTSGENNTSLDAGFILRTAGLGDFVWEDVNRNGQQDVGEPGIPGVTVTLLSSGTLVATTTTDASGLYSFTGLTPGVPYSVSFTAPGGYSATLQNVGSDVTDSDGNPVTGLTGVYSLTADEFNPTVDMGYYRPASLGDFVWVDVNQNGQQDVGEPGLPGVVVTLLDGTNTPIASTTTNASGLYSFTGLTPGVPYSVSFTTPTNYTATLANVGNDLSDSDPVGGVTAPVTLTSGENNTSLDAGFILRTAGLGDFVWEDANRNGQQDVGEPGIPNVTVSLLSSGTLVATTTTDASGLYSFTGLTPGVPYSVSFTAPLGYSATLQNIGSDVTDSDGNPVTGLTGVYSLTADEFNPTVDMGYYRPASLGDFVWVDVNQNGQQDVGEPGLPGVVVTLLDGTNTPIASTTTNASGLYSFTGLTPGVPYSVSFTTPTNYTATLANVGNDLSDSDPVGGVTAPVTLTSGENNTSLDAGFYSPSASLGDFVWVDTNQNGQQDVGEPGLPGVVVVLLDGSNSPIASTTTNASGIYSFTGLTPGVPYSVSFVAPTGYTATIANVGGDDTKDSDVNPVTGQTHSVTLAPGENNTNLDAGFVSTTVVAPVLSIQKLVSLSKANLGDLLTYTLVVSNTGSTSANATVRDSLGTGASYVANSASFPTSTSFTVGNPVSLWNIPVISAGQSLSMTYQVRIDSTGIIYNSSTIPGDTAKVCTSVSVTICMGQEYVLTATEGRASYNWYRNGVLITDQTTNVLTITEAGSYSLAPDNTSGQCADFSCCPFIVEMDSLPAFQTRVIPATCLGTNVQANGQIVLSNFKPGLQYQYSAGGTFNPAASLSGAPKVIPADGVLVSNLGNPATPQMYTVRVYNGSGCYVDQTVILLTTVCGCPADACIPFVIKQIKRPQRIGTPR